MSNQCPKCSNAIMVVQGSGNQVCPRCRYASTENIRVAQFGGAGSMGSSYSPGSSPLGRGGSGSNALFSGSKNDDGLDAIISRTHRPQPIDPERNMEKRLEQFHDYAEEDSIPYELSFKERQRLKLRKQIHRREQDQKEYANSLDENSPAYIKKHFHPTEQQMKTNEESLDKVRHHKPSNDKDPYNDQRFTNASTRIAAPYVTPGLQMTEGPDDSDSEPMNPLSPADQRIHKTPMDGWIGNDTDEVMLDQFLNTGDTLSFGDSEQNQEGYHPGTAPDPNANQQNGYLQQLKDKRNEEIKNYDGKVVEDMLPSIV